MPVCFRTASWFVPRSVYLVDQNWKYHTGLRVKDTTLRSVIPGALYVLGDSSNIQGDGAHRQIKRRARVQRDECKVVRSGQSNRQARTEHLDRRHYNGNGGVEPDKYRYAYRIDCTEE